MLTNPGFEIWQRGNGPWTTHNVMTADRWLTNVGASDVISFAREQSNVRSSQGSSLAATVTTVVSTVLGVVQMVAKPTEGGQVVGRTFTATMWVRTSTANAVRLWFYTNATNFMSGYHTGSGQWERLAVTVVMPGTDNAIYMGALFSAPCTAYLDDAMLTGGSAVVDYTPLHPAEELARCLRYYERLGDAFGDTVGSGVWASATQGWFTARFKVRKAVQPTITFVANGMQIYDSPGATWRASTALSTGFGGVESLLGSFTVASSGSAAGHSTAVTGSAVGSGIALEANP